MPIVFQQFLCLTLEGSNQRQGEMSALAESKGWDLEFHFARKADDLSYKGRSLSINRSWLEMLGKVRRYPALMLEDDARASQWYGEADLPDPPLSAGILLLGYSRYAGFRFSRTEGWYIEVKWGLGVHAVCLLGPGGRDAVAAAAQLGVDLGEALDVTLYKSFDTIPALGVPRPWLYQPAWPGATLFDPTAQ